MCVWCVCVCVCVCVYGAILLKCLPEHEFFEVLNICHKWYQIKV